MCGKNSKEGSERVSQRKVGRPKTDKPKEIKFSIRLDQEMLERLEEYCEINNISKAEAIRKALGLLLDAKKG